MTEEIAKNIVEQVNRETGLKLEYLNQTPEGSIICQDELIRRAAIVCYGSSCQPIIRSVIREKRRGKGFTWLVNGQANRNAVQLAYWDENHRYTPTTNDAQPHLR